MSTVPSTALWWRKGGAATDCVLNRVWGFQWDSLCPTRSWQDIVPSSRGPPEHRLGNRDEERFGPHPTSSRRPAREIHTKFNHVMRPIGPMIDARREASSIPPQSTTATSSLSSGLRGVVCHVLYGVSSCSDELLRRDLLPKTPESQPSYRHGDEETVRSTVITNTGMFGMIAAPTGVSIVRTRTSRCCGTIYPRPVDLGQRYNHP
jgi:hypothetical protein